jgi:RNA polymerase sigma-70 factor (ECF subfamily)
LTALANSPEVAPPSAASVAPGPAPSDAAAALYNLHRQRIYAYCVGQLRDRTEADDAVQSTFLYALALLQRGETPRSELPWLYTIAHNVCRTRRRALKRRSRLESAVDLETVQESVGRNDASREELAGLASSLATLPTAQRNALLLREWQGLSYAEIAARLGLTESAVEAVLFRARRNLAQTLRRAADRAASLTTIVIFIRRLRRVSTLTSTVKTAATAVAVSAAVAAAVQPLVSSPPRADHNQAGRPPTTAADARPPARHSSLPTTHTRAQAQTQASASDASAMVAEASIPTTASPTPTTSPPAPNAPRESTAKQSEPTAPGDEPQQTTTVGTIVSDTVNALPPTPDVTSALPPAVGTAVSTLTTAAEQAAQTVVASPPVQAVVTTATSLPTLLPGHP